MGSQCCHEATTSVTENVVADPFLSHPAVFETDSEPEALSLEGLPDPSSPRPPSPPPRSPRLPRERLKLEIAVVGARGFREPDWAPSRAKAKPDCYCEVTRGSDKLFVTSAIADCCEPVWSEGYAVADRRALPLGFALYVKDNEGSDLVGKALLPAKEYEAEGFNGELPLNDHAYVRVKVKVAGKALPPGTPPDFTTTFERTKGSSYGATFSTSDNMTLLVTGLSEGAFMDYNKGVPPHLQVKVHDFIVDVNGVSNASQKMMQELESQLRVECRIARCVHTAILYNRGPASSPIGLEFLQIQGSDYMVVQRLDPAKHNATAGTHEQLHAGDRIIAVAGVMGKSEDMIKRLKKSSGWIQLVVVRPAVRREDGEGSGRSVHWLFH